MIRIFRRVAAPWRVLIALAMALATAPSASAHVTVEPVRVQANTFLTFTVRVPTERPQPTVAVRVEFPAGFTVSRFQPKPGWERNVDRDEAGRIIAATWSGGSIAEDEYEDFQFLARVPREPQRLIFNAYQTYEDGEVIAWTGPEDDPYPAAIVDVVAADDESAAPGDAIIVEEITPLVPDVDPEQTQITPELATETIEPVPAITITVEPAVETSEPMPSMPDDHDMDMSPVPAGGVAQPAAAGTDLGLFAGLLALITALVAAAMAGVALLLARQRG